MKSGYIVYFVMALLAAMFIYSQFFDESGQHQVEPITDPVVIETYPRLYEARYAREEKLLKPFLKHESIEIRQQAWRALASTAVDSVQPYLDLAVSSDIQEPWMALSMHEFGKGQIRQLEQYWEQIPNVRSGISWVLGRQGDRESLDFLLARMKEAEGTTYEYNYALALGRLMVSYTVEPAVQHRVIEQAFQSDDPQIIRAYLYGFYRGNRQAMNEDTRRFLYSSWKGYGLGYIDEIDQYMVRLLKGDVFYEITLYQHSEDLLDANIQLAVELAQAAGDVVLNDRTKLAMRILLTHENPHVAHHVLSSLEGRLGNEEDLANFIITEILDEERSSPYVWLQALETLAKEEAGLVAKYERRLNEVAEAHPYLMDTVWAIYQQDDETEAYIDRISAELDKEDSLRKQFAMKAMGRFWSSLSEEEKDTQVRERIRRLVLEGIQYGDRGAAYAAAGLIGEEELFDGNDFGRIHTALKSFSLPEDLEVYQRYGTVFKQHFEETAQPVIDSLAALGYTPLNRSLQQAGWKVTVAEEREGLPKLRKPDWARLWEMGQNPIWVLQTEKGYIGVEMNTLVAPATISAIDSLTRAGAYNDIPFHRVIANFVIQGGDIERRDGFGGPDFSLPTEASALEFRRGAAGMASAGNDTEGSQFFFMHQWKPHLNGGYTRFGRVVRGMDVVDRILPGDRVVAAFWE
jgi:cyclophilin family peptidyl-prolyl cis-trans isomerase